VERSQSSKDFGMKTNLWKWDDTILKASIQLNKRESLVGEKKKSRAKRKEKNYSIEDDPREQLRFEAYAQEELIDRRMIDHEIMRVSVNSRDN
jgi:hypothetical protein